MGRLRNAKVEILYILTEANIPLRNIQAAKIQYEHTGLNEINLYPGHSDSEFDEWLEAIEGINYDSGYGLQFLFGTIWLKNGLWMTRGEYDGSEWWELHERPPLPKK